MGASNSRAEQPDVVPRSRRRGRHSDSCFFLGGGLKPIESPLSLVSKSVSTARTCSIRTSCSSAKEANDDLRTRLYADDALPSRYSTRMSETSTIRQLNGCDDEDMAQFLNELFHSDDAAIEDAMSTPTQSIGHRRQRTHETDYLSPSAVGWGEDEEIERQVCGSPPEDLSCKRSLRRVGSMSDSEASTPCSSPVSLHVTKEVLSMLTEDFLEDNTSISAPLGQTSCGTSQAFEDTPSRTEQALQLEPPELVSTVGAFDELEAERLRLSNLGDQIERQAKLEEALHCYELCFEHDEVLHTGLDDAAAVHLKIGIVHWKMASYQSCLDALNYVLSMYEEALGPAWLDQSPSFLNATSWTVSETFLMLCRVHLSLGEVKQARDHAKKSLAVLSTSHCLDNDLIQPMFARGLHSLGMTYEASGRHTNAFKYYREALSIQQQVHGESHIDVAASIASIGSLHESLGALDKAMKCFVDALSIYEAQSKEENCQVDVGSLLSRIGWICFLKMQNDAALEAYQEAVEIFTDVLGPYHRNLASVHVQMGMVHQRCERVEEALSFYHSGLASQRQTLSDPHNDVAITLDAMATAYETLDQPDKAIASLDQALDIRRKLLGKRHLDVGKTFASLGRLYTKTGGYQHARQCFGNAVKIYKANRLPECDKRLVEVTNSLREVVR